MNYATPPRHTVCKSRAYEKFIKSKPCIVCDKRPAQLHHVDRARGNASLCVPLCDDHHVGIYDGAYHNRAVSKFKEREAFEFHYAVNLDHVCLNLLAEFLNDY